jgi:hypothetical protein
MNQTIKFFDSNTSSSIINLCNEIKSFSETYIITAIAILSFLSSITLLFALNKIRVERLKNSTHDFQMFRYFLFKSIFEALVYLTRSLNPIISADSPLTPKNIYAIQFISMLVSNYLRSSLILVFVLCEIGAQYSCLIKININFRLYKFKDIINLVIFIIYSFSFYSYRILSYEIRTIKGINSTNISYKIMKTSFKDSLTFTYLDSFHTFFRDFICVFILFIINILIVYSFRKAIEEKKKVIYVKNSSGNKKSKANKLELLEKRTVIMVILIGFSQILGRFPTFIRDFVIFKLNTNDCFNTISTVLFYIHSLINLLIFYFFNKLVRKSLNSTFLIGRK